MSFLKECYGVMKNPQPPPPLLMCLWCLGIFWDFYNIVLCFFIYLILISHEALREGVLFTNSGMIFSIFTKFKTKEKGLMNLWTIHECVELISSQSNFSIFKYSRRTFLLFMYSRTIVFYLRVFTNQKRPIPALNAALGPAYFMLLYEFLLLMRFCSFPWLW